MAEVSVTSILAAKYVIELTWSQLQQTCVCTTSPISTEDGQMSGHKLDLFVAQCDDFAWFWCKFILVHAST